MLDLKAKLNARNVRINMAKAEIDTMSQLAEEMGVTKQAISLWLSGKSFPSDENLIGLARALKCDVAEIVILPKSIALPPIPTQQAASYYMGV